MKLFQKLRTQVFLLLFFAFSAVGAITHLLLDILEHSLSSDQVLQIAASVTVIAGLAGISAAIYTKLTQKPLKILADAIVYAGHKDTAAQAPKPESLTLGRALITQLAQQVYDLNTMARQSSELTHDGATITPTQVSPDQANLHAVLDRLYTPIIALSPNQTIVTMNAAAANYFGLDLNLASGKPIDEVIKIDFHDANTLNQWLAARDKQTPTALQTWEHVRSVNADGHAIKQFDMVASFKRAAGFETETILTFFDRTHSYGKDDQDFSFVAMAVHELRTPLTVMKGYIEVFETEIGPTLNQEMQSFMLKMRASTDQLTAFTSNILNVARIEENQLTLRLLEANWAEVLHVSLTLLEVRAKALSKNIELSVDANLPTVAVDRISIQEVMNNLVENAMKYSNTSTRIVIKSYRNAEGAIETSVQDFGIGMPPNILEGLFQKFYRSYKSRTLASGTGLGLFLCKAIVNAHGGHIWASSKEGEGSIFTFTLQPFDKMKHEQDTNQSGIMRGAHGWIKNHGLNRQ